MTPGLVEQHFVRLVATEAHTRFQMAVLDGLEDACLLDTTPGVVRGISDQGDLDGAPESSDGA